MKPKKKVPNWQKIGVFIAIISIIFNVYQHVEKKSKEKAWDVIEGRLIEKVREGTARWLGAERRVAEYEKRISESLMAEAEAYGRRDYWRNQAGYYKWQSDKNKTLAEYYEGKFKEVSVVLDLTDSEHFEFFLEWTTSGL